MALLILEGLDRAGKSTVAEIYEKKGYELIHMSAPDGSVTPDLFLEEMMQLVGSAAAKNIVLDRSYYGELVWPKVYGRESLLNDEALQILGELEESVNTERILMVDNNIEAHWKRCVDNKEPLTRAQFVQARKLFSEMADKYGFERKTLHDFTKLIAPVTPEAEKAAVVKKLTETVVEPRLTKEQMKLETANAINDVLSKRIIKGKGNIYDALENKVRGFLNEELAKIFGSKQETSMQFSAEEVELLRFFCNKLKAGK